MKIYIIIIILSLKQKRILSDPTFLFLNRLSTYYVVHGSC